MYRNIRLVILFYDVCFAGLSGFSLEKMGEIRFWIRSGFHPTGEIVGYGGSIEGDESSSWGWGPKNPKVATIGSSIR